MASFNPIYLIIHHTVTRGDISRDELLAMHLGDPHYFNDIGYHRVTLADGTTFQGRAFDKIGAHCLYDGFNDRSIGHALAGNFELYLPPPAQYSNAIIESAEICWAYGIAIENVLGHRETGAATLCPGELLDMDTYRENVKQEIPNRKYFI